MSRRAGVILIVVLALGVGCAKRPATTAMSAPAPTGGTGSSSATAAPGTSSSSTVGGARPSTPVGAAAARPAIRPGTSEFRSVSDLVDVHFDFDRADLRPDAVRTIEANARLLNGRANTLVLIEGHCDERGTTEYNLALGERRARVTMNALVSRGVDARRITVVSFGEDKPQCRDRTEACWAKNRRAHFKVKDR
jgi:peptidoglycan-associated lipoprotein